MASSGSSSVFAGFRFPREVIAFAVRWYLRYGLSYRDVEELLAERGVTVDHVTCAVPKPGPVADLGASHHQRQQPALRVDGDVPGPSR